jgi:hypothetical protein
MSELVDLAAFGATLFVASLGLGAALLLLGLAFVALCRDALARNHPAERPSHDGEA